MTNLVKINQNFQVLMFKIGQNVLCTCEQVGSKNIVYPDIWNASYPSTPSLRKVGAYLNAKKGFYRSGMKGYVGGHEAKFGRSQPQTLRGVEINRLLTLGTFINSWFKTF